jgi:hypothetical protein
MIARLPEGIALPPQLACGPLVSVWASWSGVGRPVTADPVQRLREAHRAWADAGQAWSMSFGANRNAWLSLLSPSVLDQVSVEGRQRAEDLARQRMVPQR